MALALLAGACRLAPPAMPGKDVAAHVEEEATGRGLRAAEAQAQEAVRKAREAEVAATAALQAAESAADDDAATHQQDGERYAQAIAEARAGAPGCTLEVERLIALRRQLAEYVSEPERDAAIAGLEPCRKAALKLRRQHHEKAQRDLPRGAAKDAVAAALRDEGLADPWVPVQSGALPTPGRKASSSQADALAKLRSDATAAAQAVDAAEADHERAQQGVAASDARQVQLDEADDAREQAWRGEMQRSGNRYLAVAGAAGAVAWSGSASASSSSPAATRSRPASWRSRPGPSARRRAGTRARAAWSASRWPCRSPSWASSRPTTGCAATPWASGSRRPAPA
ncbi:hypothetical protein [Nannocystis pusilla]|uniref:hypothetical protein n=1 Tax=Nannocystis pusilla TaxID=889268 RepID=UPI003B77DBE7